MWFPIPSTEGKYEVCRSGKIRNRKTKRVLTPRYEADGYIKVHLSIKGIDVFPRVHRLVAEVFCPNPDKKAEVDHKNMNRRDNRACNLQWVTRSENEILKHERKKKK